MGKNNHLQAHLSSLVLLFNLTPSVRKGRCCPRLTEEETEAQKNNRSVCEPTLPRTVPCDDPEVCDLDPRWDIDYFFT